MEDFPALAAAREALARGREAEALAAFERAVEQRPRNVRALIEAGRARAQAFEAVEAEGLLDRALEAAGGDGRVWPVLAVAYAEAYRPMKAVAVYGRMLGDARGLAGGGGAMVNAAMLCDRLNLLEEMARFVEAAREVMPGPVSWFAEGRLAQRRGEHASAAAVMRAIGRDERVDAGLRARAWAEVCEALDKLGDAEGAVAAIEAAKELRWRHTNAAELAARAERNNAVLGRLYDELDADALRRWGRERPGRESEPGGGLMAWLIGFPRTGTTLLEQMLDAHPGVVASPERAVFARVMVPGMVGGVGLSVGGLEACGAERLVWLRGRYVSLMGSILGEPIGGRVHVDKNPNHTSLIAAMVRLFPGSRFVVALRDPRDVLVSCVLRLFGLSEFGCAFRTWESAAGMFAFEMGVWLRMRELLGERGGWVEVRYEDTVREPEAAVGRALGCLGVGWDAGVMRYREAAMGKAVNSPSHAEVARPITGASVGRWRRYERWLGPAMGQLGPMLRTFGYE